MRTIARRMQALESIAHRRLGARYFSTYGDGKFYEAGAQSVNYRLGVDTAGEGDNYLSRQDIASIQAAGWECVVIRVTYVENWNENRATAA